MILREAAFWRQHDLMEQSYRLHREGHSLGARILLRSDFETLATLIYLNVLTEQVLEGRLDFHVFAEKTTTLLLGSRNNEAMPKSIGGHTKPKQSIVREQRSAISASNRSAATVAKG